MHEETAERPIRAPSLDQVSELTLRLDMPIFTDAQEDNAVQDGLYDGIETLD